MNIWIELITVVAELFLIAYFFLSYLGYPAIRKSYAIICIIVYGLCLFLLSFFMSASLLRTSIILVVTYLAIKFLFARPWLSVLYPILFFFSTAIIADVLCGLAFQISGHTVSDFMGDGVPRVAYNSMTLLLHLLFLYILLRVTKRRYEKTTLINCLPLISCIVLSSLICFYNFYTWVDNTSVTGALVGSLGLLYINILICVYVELLNRAFVKQQETTIAQHQLEIRENYYHDLMERQEETRALWHDIKKYMAAMESLVSNEKKEEAQLCLTSVDRAFSHLETSVDSGNTLVDSIFSYGIKKANSVGVIIDFQIWISSELHIPASDLFVIIGNTMDNAIEASSQMESPEERIVRINLYQKNHILVYEINNAFRTPIQKLGTVHGYGLNNVRTCVERNDGTISISTEDGCYHVLIKLNV